jgi:hypothetical protein
MVSTNEMARFETETLSTKENLKCLCGQCVRGAAMR